MRSVVALLLGAGALLPARAGADALSAPPAAEAAVEVFAPAFFARFAPQNALDMVRRVPGFSVDDGDGDRRGFGGAAGNVLIDGARPSAKATDIEDALRAIPAAQVARVELRRGAASGEAANQSVIVNVVRANAAAGTYELSLYRADHDRVTPEGSVSYAGRGGPVAYSVTVERNADAYPRIGTRTLTDAAGAVLRRRADRGTQNYRELKGSGALEATALGGTARFNLSGGRWQTISPLGLVALDPAIVDSLQLDSYSRERSLEAGGDFERAFGAWTLKAVALESRAWEAIDERTQTLKDAAQSDSFQAQRYVSSESIQRLTASRTFPRFGRLEFGAERAFNRQSSDLTLVIDGAPDALPASDVVVEEERAEAFALHAFQPAPRWSVETGLTAERSTISQSGDAAAERTLTYWKPSAMVSRALAGRDQARLRLFRDVSQLNFDDFSSSAALVDRTALAGNADLKPQTKWRLEATWDHRYGEKGALGVTLRHEWLEDAADLVPLSIDGALIDAPGNIGDGRVLGLDIGGAAPLDWLSPHTLFEYSAGLQRSEVTDPVTGRERNLSEFSDVTINADLRKEFPALSSAIGVSYLRWSEGQQYRASEVETSKEGPYLDFWAETTALRGLKITAFLNNALDSEIRRERLFFEPDRRGPVAAFEVRSRTIGRFVGFEIQGGF